MKKFLSKTGALTMLVIFLFSFMTFAFAAENLFDTLDDIKTGVETSQSRVDKGGKTTTVNVSVVDFSQKNLWGNLSSDLVKMLSVNYKSLDEIAKAAKYSQGKGNVTDLVTFLKEMDLDKSGNKYTLTTDEINTITNEIRFKGESQIQAVVLSVAKVIRNIIGGIAIIIIVISGIIMITSDGEESKITEQRRSITYAVIGLVAILLIERMVVLIYGVPGVERGLSTSGTGISDEIYGIIAFAKAVIGAVAILMIMVSGFKTITAVGEEDKITKSRKSILWVIVGIILIIVNKVIVENLYIKPVANKDIIAQSNVQAIINQIGTITQFALGFVGLIAFGALIYGGASLVANFGADEMKEKAKKIILNAIIGIIVILSAYALIATVIKFQ